MNTLQPRLRMFAGPNGSGKSTLKTLLREDLLGYYINPDDIEKLLKSDGLDLSIFGISTSERELKAFIKESQFLKDLGLSGLSNQMRLDGQTIRIDTTALNSYCASVIADFIRRRLVECRASFTFETVMSSPDKIKLLMDARSKGYRTYLYYICTNDARINVARVHNRMATGGHPVPDDKVLSRYKRSLNLLMDAIRQTNRAYLFDNSAEQQEKTWIAEITNGIDIEIKAATLPTWFQRAVLNKISASELPAPQ